MTNGVPGAAAIRAGNTQQLGVRQEGAQGWQEIHKTGATVASVSILGPGWVMSPPAAVESGSHESSMNRPGLRDNKSDVSTEYFADLVQRRWPRLGCWNTGTRAGDIQSEGCAFNYSLISRWGGKLRKKFSDV